MLPPCVRRCRARRLMGDCARSACETSVLAQLPPMHQPPKMSDDSALHTQMNRRARSGRPEVCWMREKMVQSARLLRGLGTCFLSGQQQYPMSPLELHAVVERVRCEFLEMPGLRLTPPQ